MSNAISAVSVVPIAAVVSAAAVAAGCAYGARLVAKEVNRKLVSLDQKLISKLEAISEDIEAKNRDSLGVSVEQRSLVQNQERFLDCLKNENLSGSEKIKISTLYSLKSEKIEALIPESSLRILEEKKFGDVQVKELFSETLDYTVQKKHEYEIDSVVFAAKAAGFKKKVEKKKLDENRTQVTAINEKGESVMYISAKSHGDSKVFIDTQGFEGKGCAVAVQRFKQELAKRKVFIEEKNYTFHGKREGILNEIKQKAKKTNRTASRNNSTPAMKKKNIIKRIVNRTKK